VEKRTWRAPAAQQTIDAGDAVVELDRLAQVPTAVSQA
jgi:hypothetical protein